MLSLTAPGAQSAALGVFGKIPSAADFVHVRQADDSLLSEWLQQGVERARARVGAAWDETFDAGSSYGFLFRQKDGGVLSGMLIPSEDAVGRRFPLATYVPTTVSAIGLESHLMPPALASLLSALQGALDQVEDPNDASRFFDELKRATVQSADLLVAKQQYQQWANTTTLASLWETFFAAIDSHSARYVVAMIYTSFGPFRGEQEPKTPLALRLPLSGQIMAAAFWIDLVRCAGGWKTAVPTCFWQSGRVPKTLLLQLGVTRPGSFVELWSPGADDEHVVELARLGAVNAQPFLAAVPPAVLSVLDSRTATVSELLAAASAS